MRQACRIEIPGLAYRPKFLQSYRKAQWVQELLAALEPAQMLLAKGEWLDTAWEKVKMPAGRDHGRTRLHEAALSRLRR